VTLRGRYAAGVAVVGAAGLLALAAAPPGARAGIGWGLGVGLLLQAPLGWWTLRAVGTERFLTGWGLGTLVRFGVVAVAAFALMPGPQWLAAPMLTTMVGTLVALLLVEGAVAMREHSREDER
jgi:peptidoglycan biosynthesis protein MviN/MurJ (putative lipid II flippase)